MQGLSSDGESETIKLGLPDHGVGLKHTFSLLKERFSAGIADEVKAVGHRIVHGGLLGRSVAMDAAAKAEVARAALFAPLHNPANMKGIEACESFFQDRMQVQLCQPLTPRRQYLVAFVKVAASSVHTSATAAAYRWECLIPPFIKQCLRQRTRTRCRTICLLSMGSGGMASTARLSVS